MNAIRVAVIEEHDIFRRGIVACLADDLAIGIVYEGPTGPAHVDPDVAVVSHTVALSERLACSLVVCSTDGTMPPGRYDPNAVLGVVQRSTVTGEQLIATVRAAAAGLRVHAPDAVQLQLALDDRSLEVLRMLSRGADTHQISHELCYSERTVKTLISDLQRNLGARNRTHAVAEGIRQGII